MRLWHEVLIPRLTDKDLYDLYSHCCEIRSHWNDYSWFRFSGYVNKVIFNHPYEWLWAYHMRVINEMLNRGKHVKLVWFDLLYQGPTRDRKNPESIDIEGINAKLAAPQVCIYPEHDDKYLEECLKFLKRRGYKDLREKMNL